MISILYCDLGFRPYRTALLLNVYNSVLLELFLVRSFQAKATEFISYIKTNILHVFGNCLLTWATVHNQRMYVLICINTTTDLNIGLAR